MTASPGNKPAMMSAAGGYLEPLAELLRQRGLTATIDTAPGRPVRLHVANPQADKLAEDIYAGPADGEWWFWWSWAERVAQVDDLDAAADRVAHVLAAIAE